MIRMAKPSPMVCARCRSAAVVATEEPGHFHCEHCGATGTKFHKARQEGSFDPVRESPDREHMIGGFRRRPMGDYDNVPDPEAAVPVSDFETLFDPYQ